MSLENAKKFITQVIEVETLRKRTANKSQEETMAIAKELGLDFTLEELKEAIDDEELISPDDLDSAAGGRHGLISGGPDSSGDSDKVCHANPNGSEHNWVTYSHEEDEWFGGLFSQGYDHQKCTYCGHTRKVGT